MRLLALALVVGGALATQDSFYGVELFDSLPPTTAYDSSVSPSSLIWPPPHSLAVSGGPARLGPGFTITTKLVGGALNAYNSGILHQIVARYREILAQKRSTAVCMSSMRVHVCESFPPEGRVEPASGAASRRSRNLDRQLQCQRHRRAHAIWIHSQCQPLGQPNRPCDCRIDLWCTIRHGVIRAAGAWRRAYASHNRDQGCADVHVARSDDRLRPV